LTRDLLYELAHLFEVESTRVARGRAADEVDDYGTLSLINPAIHRDCDEADRLDDEAAAIRERVDAIDRRLLRSMGLFEVHT
jgi:hypothetical protein